MKKIVFLCALSLALFAAFYLYLTSPALSHPLGWQLLPLTALGVGASWALVEALYTVINRYVERCF